MAKKFHIYTKRSSGILMLPNNMTADEFSFVRMQILSALETFEKTSLHGKSVAPDNGPIEGDPSQITWRNKKWLSVRARKIMIRLGIETVAQLAEKSADDLMEVKNCGPSTVSECRRFLERCGLKLKGDA